MSSLVNITHIIAILLLHIPLTEVSEALSMTHSKVILFPDVWHRSVCQPMEILVDVEKEYPGVVKYIFSPRCVPLRRCAGCCNDEKLHCSPTRIHNVTIQMIRISPAQSTKQYVELSFYEHRSCKCSRQQLNRPYRGRKWKTRKKDIRKQ